MLNVFNFLLLMKRKFSQQSRAVIKEELIYKTFILKTMEFSTSNVSDGNI